MASKFGESPDFGIKAYGVRSLGLSCAAVLNNVVIEQQRRLLWRSGKHKHLLNAELSEFQMATAFDLISLVELAPLKTKISQLEADLIKLQSEFLEDLRDLLDFTDFHPRPSEDGWTEFFSSSSIF
jgi:hypothetical protein